MCTTRTHPSLNSREQRRRTAYTPRSFNSKPKTHWEITRRQGFSRHTPIPDVRFVWVAGGAEAAAPPVLQRLALRRAVWRICFCRCRIPKDQQTPQCRRRGCQAECKLHGSRPTPSSKRHSVVSLCGSRNPWGCSHGSRASTN